MLGLAMAILIWHQKSKRNKKVDKLDFIKSKQKYLVPQSTNKRVKRKSTNNKYANP